MKIVTLCGSMRFQKEMRKIAQKLEIDEGYLVIQCVYFDAERYEPCHHIILHNNKYTLL